MRRRLTNKRLAFLIVGVAAGWAFEWTVFLSADLCGVEDELRCTTLGWVGLYLWMAWGLVLAVLLGIAAMRIVRRLLWKR